MNHPLHDHQIHFNLPHSPPLAHDPAPSPIKPFSAPELNSTPSSSSPPPPPPSLPNPYPPQLDHPSCNFPARSHHPSHPHSTLKKITRAIKKSTSIFNRLVRSNRKPSETAVPTSSLPASVDLDPPHPLQSSPPNSNSCAPCPSSSTQTHPPYLHGLSISPFSPADAASPNPCHSPASSGEFSFRLVSNHDHGSPSSAHSRSHANWIRKLSQSHNMRRLPWSDQNSNPTLNSNAGRCSSPAQCSSPGSTGTRRYCNSPSPNHLQPVFGIPVKEALRLASQEYRTNSKKVEIPTIVHKCGERLKCPEGMKSHGVFRINGNIKRMRKLESVFMNPDGRYGTDFDISNPIPPTDPKAMEEINHPQLELNSQPEPYFTLHDVAGVLRRYLWALPVWRKFHGRQEENSHEVLMGELERGLKENMEREELDLLTYLLEILGLFSIRSEDNLMNSKNLAIVFQPGIMPLHLSEEDQISHQHQGQNYQHSLNLPQLSKSRSTDQISHHSQQQVPGDYQQRSTLQVANGIGLDDYLGQINEVQDILGVLIDHSALQDNGLSVKDLPNNWQPPSELHNNHVSGSQPHDHSKHGFKGSGDDGG